MDEITLGFSLVLFSLTANNHTSFFLFVEVICPSFFQSTQGCVQQLICDKSSFQKFCFCLQRVLLFFSVTEWILNNVPEIVDSSCWKTKAAPVSEKRHNFCLKEETCLCLPSARLQTCFLKSRICFRGYGTRGSVEKHQDFDGSCAVLNERRGEHLHCLTPKHIFPSRERMMDVLKCEKMSQKAKCSKEISCDWMIASSHERGTHMTRDEFQRNFCFFSGMFRIHVLPVESTCRILPPPVFLEISPGHGTCICLRFFWLLCCSSHTDLYSTDPSEYKNWIWCVQILPSLPTDSVWAVHLLPVQNKLWLPNLVFAHTSAQRFDCNSGHTEGTRHVPCVCRH